ncbi:MAG: riboflavin synthase, partial [Acidimicrobiia bacterium]
MFTGIVEAMGEVQAVEETETGRRLEIVEPHVLADIAIGDSVAVNGVCLTAVRAGAGSMTVEVVQESLDRTSLGSVAPGTRVN